MDGGNGKRSRGLPNRGMCISHNGDTSCSWGSPIPKTSTTDLRFVGSSPTPFSVNYLQETK